LLQPYLQEFAKLNPESVVAFERNEDTDSVDKCFICPGIMSSKLRHVCPIISLDGAHLRSEWKGTLYIATVQSGLNEIIPIALALTADNENMEGWLFFLEHLKEACPTITMHNILRRCNT
jgi:hypothetical protein